MRFARLVLTGAVLLSLGRARAVLAEEQDAPPGDQGTPPAQDDSDTTDVKKRLEEIEQKLRVLERQKEVEQDVAAGKSKDAATVGAGKDGFFLKSADGAYQLKIRALVQTDGRFRGDDEARPAIDTFEMRRVRPIFEGTVGKFFDFRIVPDFGEGKTVLQDAYADWRFASWIRLRAGKTKMPFGLERLQSASDAVFVERALPTNLVPNRDIGLQLQGDVLEGVISYALGVFNGVVDVGSADADVNDSKETAARVFFQPFKKASVLSLQNLGLGVAATYGNNAGTIGAPGLPSYKTPGQQTFFSYRSDTPATAAGTTIADGRRHRLSPQAYWYVGRFGALTEYVESYQEVEIGTSEQDLKTTSWQVAATLALTDDRPTYRAISPRRPFDPASHAWGAFEIAVRAGALKVDDKAFPTFADPAKAAGEARERGAGINWYLNRNVKLMLDYIQARFKDGDATGDREDEKILLNRIQIAF
jgi:phosphate-selective porin OprO/OprP